MTTLIYRAAVNLNCPSYDQAWQIPYTYIGTDFSCAACGQPWPISDERAAAIHAAFDEAWVKVSEADQRGDERPIGIADIGDTGTVRKPS